MHPQCLLDVAMQHLQVTEAGSARERPAGKLRKKGWLEHSSCCGGQDTHQGRGPKLHVPHERARSKSNAL